MSLAAVVFPEARFGIGWMLAFSLVAFALMVYWIHINPRRQRRGLRMLMGLAALIALISLGLRPHWEFTAPTEVALLLTEGADASWQSFINQHPDPMPVFALPGAFPSQHAKVDLIPDADYLARNMPHLRNLHVFGHGLEPWDLEALSALKIQTHFSVLPMGIRAISWSTHIELGDSFQLQGALSMQPSDADFQLTLITPGGTEHELALEQGLAFSYRVVPRAPGKYHYLLRGHAGTDHLIFQESLPVQVDPPRGLAVLILEGAPNFETKYLKNWLASAGYAHLIRSRISKDRFRWEYGLLPETPFQVLDKALLSKFDLILLDRRSWQALSAFERSTLLQAIADGLGLLIDFRHEDPASELDAPFDRFSRELLADLSEREAPIKPIGKGAQPLPPIPLEPASFLTGPAQMPLFEDEAGRLLAVAVPWEQGRIGASLVRQTYRWVLAGHSSAHAIYWSHLFSQLARNTRVGDRWYPNNRPPFLVNHPLELALETRVNQPSARFETAESAQASLSLKQDPWLETRWWANYWPREAGWHRVATSRGKPYAFYVHDEGSWPCLRAARRMAATEAYAVRTQIPVPGSSDSPEHVRQTRELNPLWFFAVFLAAMAVLWLERKWPS